MTSTHLRITANGSFLRIREVPLLAMDIFLQELIDCACGGWRVSALFAHGNELWGVLAGPDAALGMMRTQVDGAVPSIAEILPQIHLFEREIAEQSGLEVTGLPVPLPVRFTGRNGRRPLPGVADFYRVEGEEVHEVAVGPVHAGVIEPGHFRFQCHGEEVFDLEIALGYQHRGIEEQLPGGPHPLTLYRMETVAGDTTIGHCLAYCMNLEGLGAATVPERGEALRGVALELERLANHGGDLGALAGDVGYLPTSSFCGRLRGDLLNMTALLCGSRFGRGMVRPGGSGFDCPPSTAEELVRRLDAARSDLESAVELLWHTTSVMERFERTGTVARETARELGLVGPAARASGLQRDVRRDHPFGIFRRETVALAGCDSGDVCARAQVRWQECRHSLDYVERLLLNLPPGPHHVAVAGAAPEAVCAALTEGWRGEICHVAITDARGRFARYKIVDPSFHNWAGLSMALRNGQISDFPLCNKSFNLSYCGHDL